MKPRLLVLNGTCLDIAAAHRAEIEAAGVEFVAEESFRSLTAAQLGPLLAEADAIVLPAAVPVGAAHMAGRRLKSIAIAASGYEWLDLDAATRNGIVVTNAPVPMGAEVVADMAWGLMLGVARQIPFHDAAIRARRSGAAANDDAHGNLMRHSQYPRGIGVAAWRKTLGIIGLGNIGKAVARRAAGFEMRVLAATPNPNREFAAHYGIEIVALDELLAQSDFISLHARLNATTRGLLGAREFGLMKPDALLINTARPQLVDEAALTTAILAGRIGGAAFDDPPPNPDSPLLDLPNVVFTTHLGNRAAEGMHAVFASALQSALMVLRGERPPYLLNPQVYALSEARL